MLALNGPTIDEVILANVWLGTGSNVWHRPNRPGTLVPWEV